MLFDLTMMSNSCFRRSGSMGYRVSSLRIIYDGYFIPRSPPVRWEGRAPGWVLGGGRDVGIGPRLVDRKQKRWDAMSLKPDVYMEKVREEEMVANL